MKETRFARAQIYKMRIFHTLYVSEFLLVCAAQKRIPGRLTTALLAFEIGKCTFFLWFSEHPSHAPVGYGEIPKSCTMENRQNLIEHQLYATIQRKQPPVPPFTTDTPCARKGFTDSTVERFKRLNNGEMCPYVGAKPENGMLASTNARCATLGRMKNLEMTEYQQQKFYNGAHNIVSPNFPIFEFSVKSQHHRKIILTGFFVSKTFELMTL